jgi:hypothetical protein
MKMRDGSRKEVNAMSGLPDPVCITQVTQEQKEVSERLIEAKAHTTVIDPTTLLDRDVVTFDDVERGDWVSKQYWRRPRRVVEVDRCGDGPILFLAEPDEARAVEGIRRVDRDRFDSTSWFRYPQLRTLWEAAHA